ncbi:endonuclease/exonuclease/phosphatase family protein [Herbidospora yilanensis]|uniref:endonuclease/exonuclease/phosphatase family protein n=1 Tax=Herbidospora yilanensis TaxID=354426 RepID=UPI00078042C5|nr:endonuclease/exonuclease/phosphatase family protein [Herbidospora yilanensis]
MRKAAGFAAAGWLGFVILHHLLTGRFWVWLIPDMIPPALYLAVPVTILAAARCRGRAALLAAGSLLLGAAHAGLNPAALTAPDGPPPPGAVRVFSWNTEYWHQDDDPRAFYRFLTDQHADVYVLQEYLNWVGDQPREAGDLAALRREFPGYHLAAEGELVTLSRFPVTAVRRVGPAADLGPRPSWRAAFDLAKILRTDLRIGASTLSVYNVHVPAQYVLNENPFTARFYTELRGRGERRAAQFGGLLADLAANPAAALVSGDFNSTGAMGELRPLFDRLTSANTANRAIYPTSWYAGVLPLWQLDWTFTTGVTVHTSELADPRGLSDHRAQSLAITMRR